MSCKIVDEIKTAVEALPLVSNVIKNQTEQKQKRDSTAIYWQQTSTVA